MAERAGSERGFRLPPGRAGAQALAVAMLVAACAGSPRGEPGVRAGGLAPCPASPNCVSSQARDASHRVASIRLRGTAGTAADFDAAWHGVVRSLRALPRSRVVAERDDYLHVEVTSALMRYVDDLEVWRRSPGIVEVRSASRIGYSDMGVNRGRVEALRAALVGQGLAEPG